jgi:hypothetical protein
MRKRIVNPEFPDLYRFSLWKDNTRIKDLIKARSSELSDPDFIETDFRYTQGKLEFGSPDILSELEVGDKEMINIEGAAGVEKFLTTLFPTQSRNTSPISEDDYEYYSSLTKIGGDEIFCLLIPEKVDTITAYDSHDTEALVIEFQDEEVRDSKALWILTSYNESKRELNLSYEAFKTDRNPIRRMSDYVLRNDSLTENWNGYIERDGFLYSNISNSLIGTSKLSNRPIYELKCRMVDEGWNRSRRYSIGDTAKIGDAVFRSVEENNIGNHPYYSRMWVKI